MQKKHGQLKLAPNQLALVRAVLRTHPPHHRAYVFGSRVVVVGAADRPCLKPHSDLDVALEGPRLKLHQAYALKVAFGESDLPMREDAVALDDLSIEWEIRAWLLDRLRVTTKYRPDPDHCWSL